MKKSLKAQNYKNNMSNKSMSNAKHKIFYISFRITYFHKPPSRNCLTCHLKLNLLKSVKKSYQIAVFCEPIFTLFHYPLYCVIPRSGLSFHSLPRSGFFLPVKLPYHFPDHHVPKGSGFQTDDSYWRCSFPPRTSSRLHRQQLPQFVRQSLDR